MLYLLEDYLTPPRYQLFKVDTNNNTIGFINKGSWRTSIPNTLEFTGSPLNDYPDFYWWEKEHSEYVDAKLIEKFKTEEEYKEWLHNHPELLI